MQIQEMRDIFQTIKYSEQLAYQEKECRENRVAKPKIVRITNEDSEKNELEPNVEPSKVDVFSNEGYEYELLTCSSNDEVVPPFYCQNVVRSLPLEFGVKAVQEYHKMLTSWYRTTQSNSVNLAASTNIHVKHAYRSEKR